MDAIGTQLLRVRVGMSTGGRKPSTGSSRIVAEPMATPMGVVLQHRLAAAIVLVAVAGMTGVLVFTSSRMAPASEGKALVFSEAQPAVRGWIWAAGTPGFRFGDHDDEWNISGLSPSELDGVEQNAAAAGLRPETLGVLAAMRSRPGVRPQLLVAGAGAAGSTCIGAQPHVGPASFACSERLDATLAVLLAEASPARGDGRGMFLTGVVRGDVARVAIVSPGATYTDEPGPQPVVKQLGPQTAYDRRNPLWWGTFTFTTAQPGPWHAHVVFYGQSGELGSVDLRFQHPGERVSFVQANS